METRQLQRALAHMQAAAAFGARPGALPASLLPAATEVGAILGLCWIGRRHIKLADLGSARSTLLEKQLRSSGVHHSKAQQQLAHSCDGSGQHSQHQQQQQQVSMARQDSVDHEAQGSPSQRQQQQHGQQQQGSPSRQQQLQEQHGGRLRPVGPPVHHSDSFTGEAANASPSEIFAR